MTTTSPARRIDVVPPISQGGMGVGVSSWQLAAAVAGVAVWVMLTRRTLIERDPDRVTQPAVLSAPERAPPSSGAGLSRGGDGGMRARQPQ